MLVHHAFHGSHHILLIRSEATKIVNWWPPPFKLSRQDSPSELAVPLEPQACEEQSPFARLSENIQGWLHIVHLSSEP